MAAKANKFVWFGETKFDISGDDVVAEDVTSGKKFHGRDGEQYVGTSTKDSDTSDATAIAADVLAPNVVYARGERITGTMPSNGSVAGTIGTKAGEYTVPYGFHDGGGKVSITNVDALVPANVREGVSILGVVGEMSASEGENAEESKTVTPSRTQQTVLPSEGYTCLRSVVVEGIPYQETANAAGGITVTIG